MKTKTIILLLFLITVVAQLAVPGKMIFDRETVLKEGTTLKFRTAPVDPYDPFRGKYITLNYKDDVFAIKSDTNWTYGQEVFITFKKDSMGFALIDSVLRHEPTNTSCYLKTVTNYASNTTLNIDFPFDRFYMEESKAYEAEKQYNISRRDSTSVTCALVNIKDGKAVLKDVLIDNKPIKEVVEAIRKG